MEILEVCKACGYVPVHELLHINECVVETIVISDTGEYLALTDKGRLLLVSHWYGDSENIVIPNVARTVESIINRDNAKLADAFIAASWDLLDQHYIDPFSTLPNGLRIELEQLINYMQKKIVPPAPKNIDKTDKYEYVYFLTADNGLTKIGRTSDLTARMHHFTTKLPYELTETLILKTKNSGELEAELHSRFAEKRVRGEWFMLSIEDISWVEKQHKTVYQKYLS